MLCLFFLSVCLHLSVSIKSPPLVVTTWAFPGFQEATKTALRCVPGGRLWALVEGLSSCENNQCDGTVGYGGSPDESGHVRLDALLMDGPGHRVGSVAHLPFQKDAARVAWAVMNYTKHTLLVGEAASEFAYAMGFKKEQLNTSTSEKLHSNWKANNCQPNFWQNVSPDPATSCGPYKPSLVLSGSKNYREINRFNHDTIGMVIIDENRNISAGTSTNGATHKISGRVGDSPIIGAGAYVVEGVGGAAATGDGDIMMRFLPSYQTVEFMRSGTKPHKAASKALMRILDHYPNFQGAVVAANVHGKYGAACANLKIFKYSIGVGQKTFVESVSCL